MANTTKKTDSIKIFSNEKSVSHQPRTGEIYWLWEKSPYEETCYIEKTREADIKRLYTNAGPHTHDLVLNLSGRDARIYGSQGQQRSCALAMKLGEASIIEKITGECPVVLLDDVMSELDEGRQKYLLEKIEDFQVFITCCQDELFKKSDKQTFYVENGQIEKKE